VWVVGDNGGLWRGNATGFGPLGQRPTVALDWSALHGQDSAQVWLVGQGSVWFWDGSAWQERFTTANARFKDVWSVGSTEVWLVAEPLASFPEGEAYVWHSVDGTAFAPVFLPSKDGTTRYDRVVATTGQGVFVQGEHTPSLAPRPLPVLWHFDGTTWLEQTPATRAPLGGLFATDGGPTEIWLGSTDGILRRAP
jgi:hypothetical protein